MAVEVLIPIADGSEDMEAVIAIDMFRRASFKVTVAGLDGQCKFSRGVQVIPDMLMQSVPVNKLYDLIFLPGGNDGTKNLADNTSLKKILINHSKNGRVIAAICAAPIILHEHGIISFEDSITSHPSVADELSSYNYKTDRIVKSGNIYTSRGAGTAFDLTLELITNFVNKEAADRIADSILLR